MAENTVTHAALIPTGAMISPQQRRHYKALYAVEFFERKTIPSYALWSVKLREGRTYPKTPSGYGRVETLEQAHVAITDFCQARGLSFVDIRQEIGVWRLVKDLLEGKSGAEYFARQMVRRGGQAIQHAPVSANNLVVAVNDQPMTTSFIVAEKFGKRHADVLRAIENLPKDSFTERNYALGQYPDKKGADRPMYYMTWKGFSMLGMGFTGKKAYAWKQTFLDAFEAMGEEINRRKAHYADPPRTSALSLKQEAHRPMMAALSEFRADQGKETDERHFMCENKLCNGIVTGDFSAADEKGLSNDDLVLLAKVRRRNESMLHVGFSYGERKKLLTEFATRERTKAISASTKTREPSLCAT